MKHNAVLTIPPVVKDNMKECLTTGGLMAEDETVVYTVRFINGFEMDVKVCGGDDDPAWTEAVLYDQNGSEIACSDPSDELTGEWALADHSNNIYSVTVV